ncbi:MAG: hypothetical protein DMF62_04895 [Acidobacteria bacterium]|nr:MAG: hypothetical protein DMF62_04895 [Acidobacteriota bacterium]
MGSPQAAIALIGGILGCIATAVGIFVASRNYVAQQRAKDAASEARRETANLRERAGAIEALQKTVTSQSGVIDGLSQGLKDCIVRDNQKAIDISDLQQKDYAKAVEIDTLRRRIAVLEAR